MDNKYGFLNINSAVCNLDDTMESFRLLLI